MKSGHRRLALLSGVSILAFVVSAPATASSGNHPAIAAATDENEPVVICNIAADCSASERADAKDVTVDLAAVAPGSWQNDLHNQLTIGTADQLISDLTSIHINPGAAAAALAQITCATSGQCPNPGAIVQRATAWGSEAANSIVNAGELGLAGRARASGSTALASIFLQTAIWQHASGLQASNQLSNEGLVDISLAADAIATAGDAIAFADLGFGALTQTAIATASGGEAANRLANEGRVTVDVAAHASGARSALAAASAAAGVIQQAIGVGSADASNSLDNEGSITIDLSATAEASENAYAQAEGARGLVQGASGGNATDKLVNEGTVGMSVDADADGGRFASALAVLRTAVSQTAGGGSNASASIDFENAGSLSLHADAVAGGEGGAVAQAVLDRALFQIAGAEQAAISMSNSGSLGLSAAASAAGIAGATAYAGQWGGIIQQAHGGNASVRFANSGDLSISAAAAATAADGNAIALAEVLPSSSGAGAILQYANGADGAAAAISNAGTISIMADAEAHAAGTAHSFGHDAVARAEIVGAIQQIAESEGGAASATFLNSSDLGTAIIDLTAVAHADGQSGQGTAFAGIATGLVQVAAGTNASAVLRNDGTLNFAAAAAATGPVEAINAHFSTTSMDIFLPVPGAKAGVTNALVQVAQAIGGGAAADLANSGSLAVTAAANANAERTALASASVFDAVGQAAFAVGGSAGAEFANSGSIGIAAVAAASGSLAGGTATYVINTGAGGQTSFQVPVPGARAAVQDAIRQNVIAAGTGTARGPGADGAGPASAVIANTGTIDISASAIALGVGLASAHATISSAIFQDAISAGSSADATIDNSGLVDIGARASASATGGAFAAARGRPAILQAAQSSTGRASATLSNEGELEVAAVADATGRTAGATAAVVGAIAQVAVASAGDAAIALGNSGAMGLSAIAMAEGGRSAIADAGAGSRSGGGAAQTAIALGGSAGDRIDNQGSIRIAGLASAIASDGWAQAIGHVDNGLVQNAWGASATADLENSGSIALVAAGTAHGASATGDGVIAGGIEQLVAASGTVIKSLDGTESGHADGAEAILSNSGSISISGIGNAKATGPAAAVGFVGGAIDQHVSAAAGPATASIDNDGGIAIAAAAYAQGAGAIATFGSWSSVLGGANAFAVVSGGVVQAVSALASDADAGLANSGSLSISALASAEGPGISALVGTGSTQTVVTAGPRATAVVLGAIDQDIAAGAGSAEASLANSGALQIGAAAKASGGNGPEAVAFIGNAIFQSADSLSSDAVVAQLNSGTMGIVASADAVATGPGGVVGQATVFSGNYQHAHASAGAAEVSLDNSGALTIGALASASATEQSGRAQSASAVANLFGGLVAGAEGSGGASADLQNSGSITIAAAADARAFSGAAQAAALATRALQESASGGIGGARATIDNSGTIAVGARAEATAATAAARAHVLTALADFVSSSGSADALVANTGLVQVAAEASAVAVAGAADAGAGVVIGVGELISAGGSASAVLANSATMQFAAIADAVAARPGDEPAGPAFASAHLGGVTFIGVHGILSQDLRAGEGTARVDNSGLLSAAAAAAASGTQATASANIISAVRQNVRAVAGDALEMVSNAGSMLIGATASANAGAGPALAVATVGNAIDQDVRSSDDGRASVDNSGTIAISARGAAAGQGDAAAAAIARGVSQSVSVARPSGASAEFANSGDFSLSGIATASAGTGVAGTGSAAHQVFGSAIASLTGVAQTAAHVNFANSGTFAVADSALASGADAYARAHALGVVQRPAQAAETASAAFLNDGLLTVDAHAVASGGTGIASASASGYRLAASDVAFDGSNSGTLSVHASALAPDQALALAHGLVAGSIATSGGSGTGSALLNGGDEESNNLANSGTITVTARAAGETVAQAVAADGMLQASKAGSVSQSMANSGDIALTAHAEIDGSDPGFPFAGAVATDAMAQYAQGSVITQQMENGGSVSMGVSTQARGRGRIIAAAAGFTPMGQQATGVTVAQTLMNSGTATAVANAEASAVGTLVDMPDGQKLWGVAMVQARALGLGQIGNAREAAQQLSNSGVVNVVAKADAVAPGAGQVPNEGAAGAADSWAFALGAFQSNNATLAGTQSFTNAGTFNVAAIAGGDAAAAAARATAEGYRAFAHGFTTQHLVLSNSGAINVAASGEAHGVAYAEAIGLHVGNAATSSAPFQAFPIQGSLENSGSIEVLARADGDTFTRHSGAGSTAHSYTYGGSSAFATGIVVSGGPDRLKISNSGVIRADAITTGGGEALAQGIVAIGNGSSSPAPDDVLTIENSGDIIVRQSVDGGTSWSRGIAISVAGYPDRNVPPIPNSAVINLLGGSIYGNIRLRGGGGDAINVAGGETSFDGIINPDLAAAGAGDSGVGTLTIASGGSLYLRDRRFDSAFAPMYDGPSFAYVSALSVESGGKLALDLAPVAGGAQAAGSYSQVVAGSANLGGALEVRLATANGLFADRYSWDNVIDAGSRTGEFNSCRLGGGYSGSLLLGIACSYDSAANVDVTLTRRAFDSVDGLNRNGAAAGSGLEAAYDENLSGGSANLFGDLFRISDAAGYNRTLNQLAGTSYANYLKSFDALGSYYNDLIDSAVDCERQANVAVRFQCRGDSPVRLWSRLGYQWQKADGDSEAGATSSQRSAALMGADFAIGKSGLAGISAGAVTNHLRDRQFGDEIKADGFQVGAYGVYDRGPYFLKGIATYSRFDGDSRRSIDFGSVGGSFASSLHGDPDVALWTLGLHAGARIPIEPASVLTPYADLDYSRANLDKFDEHSSSGSQGAELHVSDSHASGSMITAGVQWLKRLGNFGATFDLGYRYAFGSRRTAVSENLVCESPACAFDIVSARAGRGTFRAGLSAGGRIGPVDIRITYNGEFNSHYTSHSAGLKLVLPLGGPIRGASSSGDGSTEK